MVVPDKEISIWIEAPEPTKSEVEEMLGGIKLAYRHRVIFKGKPD